MRILIVVWILTGSAAASVGEDLPPCGIPVGPETTVLDGPLDEYGYVDYAAALRGMNEDGLDADQNAATIAFELFFDDLRRELDDETFAAACDGLGIDANVRPSTQMLTVNEYLASVPAAERDAARAQFVRAEYTLAPFADVPHVERYAAANGAAVKRIVGASERRGYAFMLPGEEPLFSRRMPLLHRKRELTRLLQIEALRRVRVGDLRGGAELLDARSRLARLMNRERLAIEGIVAVAIDRSSLNAEVALLGKLSDADAVRARMRAYEAAAPIDVAAASVRRYERFAALEVLQLMDLVRRIEKVVSPSAEMAAVNEEALRRIEKLAEFEPAATRRIVAGADLGVSSKEVNKLFDLSAAVATGRTLEEERATAAALDAATESVRESLGSMAVALVFAKTKSKSIGRIVGTLMLPAVPRFRSAERRQVAANRLRTAAALTRLFQLRTGRLPRSPEELPGSEGRWPSDPFTDRPLLWSAPPGGPPRIYSVGQDGVAGGGPPLDDVVAELRGW